MYNFIWHISFFLTKHYPLKNYGVCTVVNFYLLQCALAHRILSYIFCCSLTFQQALSIVVATFFVSQYLQRYVHVQVSAVRENLCATEFNLILIYWVL